MKVEIENLAKLGRVSLDIKGITVITGENNTGKSTIGKTLFAFFNAASGIDEQIKEYRRNSIEEKILFSLPRSIRFRRGLLTEKHFIKFKINDLNEIISINDLNVIIRSLIKDDFDKIPNEELETSLNYINELIEWPKEKIAQEIFTNRFNRVFNNQINSLLEKDTNASIVIKIKDDINTLKFKKNNCIESCHPTIISNNCIYIDDPFILDECGPNISRRGGLSNYKKRKTVQFLDKYFDEDDSEENMLDSSMKKSKMDDIFSKLDSMAEGKVIANNGFYYFKQKEYKEDLNLHNLSAGLKSVVILKMLIQKLLLKDRDLLILDEPEIHLHPKWQIVYAEIIVLLQKLLNLHIVITTHSHYFLDAIELYSKKHDIYSKFNCYLSNVDNSNKVNFTEITNNLEQSYEKLAYPIAELNTLRYNIAESGK